MAEQQSIATWEQLLTEVLGRPLQSGDTAITREQVAGLGVRWIAFDWAWKQDHAYEGGVADDEIVGWAKDGTVSKTAVGSQFGGIVLEFPVYQVVRAKVKFPTAATGTVAPSAAYRTLMDGSAAAVNALVADTLTSFSRSSLDGPINSFKGVEKWLKEADDAIKSWISKIDDDSSGFQGSASAMLLAALQNFHNDMRKLMRDTHADTDTDAWSQRLTELRDTSMKTFSTEIQTAWNAYAGVEKSAHAPAELVETVRGVVENFKSGVFTGVSFGDKVPGLVSYDLTTELGWERLDSDMKTLWLKRLTSLDDGAKAALTKLETAMADLATELGRKITAPKQHEPQVADPTGGTPSDGSSSYSPSGYSPSGYSPTDYPASGYSPTDYSASGYSPSDYSPADYSASGDSSGSSYGASSYGASSGYGDSSSGYASPDYSSSGGGGSYDSGLSGSIGAPTWATGYTPIGSGSASTGKNGSGSASGTGAWGELSGDGVDSSLFPTGVDTVDVGDLAGAGDKQGASSGAGIGAGVSSLLGEDAADGALLTSTESGLASFTGSSTGSSAGSMPFMPPMGALGGGGGQGAGQKERERKTWLEEDEEVWGADPGCAPAVIGRGNLPDSAPVAPGQPAAPRRTSRTAAPARGVGRA